MKNFFILLILIISACSSAPEVAPPIVVPTAAAPVGGNPVGTAAPAAIGSGAYPAPAQTKINATYQNFERGFMINLTDRKQVWVFVRPIIVMTTAKDAPNYGQWLSYADTFKDGEAETDPTFTAHGNFVQPKRALGKVWRENSNVRTGLGWGVEAEQNFSTTLTTYPIGTLEGGKFTPKFAFHLVTLPDNSLIHLNESTRSWSKP